MAEEPEKDREPWSPRIEGIPLFINSADYEHSLAEDSRPPEDEASVDGQEEVGESLSPEGPDPDPAVIANAPKGIRP